METKGPGGRPTDYKPEYCEMLIKHMAEGDSFASFSAIVGTCMDTVHEWAKVHPEFSDAKKKGMGLNLLFNERLMKSGIAGQLTRVGKKTKITTAKTDTKAEEVKEETEFVTATYAQTAHIFLMKNRFPKEYRDKIQIETTAKDDSAKVEGVIKQLMNDPATAEVAQRIAEALNEETE